MKKRYEVTRGCTFCGTCLFECPVEAVTLEKTGAEIDQEKCMGCGNCYENCASEAIEEVQIGSNQ